MVDRRAQRIKAMVKRKPQSRRAASWSAPLPVADIPETGRNVELAADAATRARLAESAGVVALPRLEVAAELTRQGSDNVRAVGQVSATVEQTCVVTLEPMERQIVEPFDVVFAPSRAVDAHPPIVTPDDDNDPPEVIRDGAVDIGALAVEFLMLGIDPYPRKPGAQFAAPAAREDAANPFAALAALKKPT
jgi:uncharacterized metal-binding protein YceD (DUF177 family)